MIVLSFTTTFFAPFASRPFLPSHRVLPCHTCMVLLLCHTAGQVLPGSKNKVLKTKMPCRNRTKPYHHKSQPEKRASRVRAPSNFPRTGRARAATSKTTAPAAPLATDRGTWPRLGLRALPVSSSRPSPAHRSLTAARPKRGGSGLAFRRRTNSGARAAGSAAGH